MNKLEFFYYSEYKEYMLEDVLNDLDVLYSKLFLDDKTKGRDLFSIKETNELKEWIYDLKNKKIPAFIVVLDTTTKKIKR